MAEWLIEEGIGEDRAVLTEGDRVIAARLHWPGSLTVGQVEEVQTLSLNSSGIWRKYGLVRFASGEEAYASRLPHGTTQGARVRVKVTRERLAERGRLKLAQAQHTDQPLQAAPTLHEQLIAHGHTASIVRRFPANIGWEEIFNEAWTGDVAFAGGALIISDTPAMTLIDVDLRDHVEALVFNGVPALCEAIRRLDIAGNIGIDFPTLDKQDRQVIDAKLGQCLAEWPHERTAMNGFGFVQIIARMSNPSLLQRIGRDRAGAAARLLLRRAEQLEGIGSAVELSAHPAVLARISEDWRAQLTQRTGRRIVGRANPALAIEAPHAQIIAS